MFLSGSVAKALALNDNPSTSETQQFVEMFDKFFDLLNIRSSMESIRTRNVNKEPYKDPSDERLNVCLSM